jgi:hypothetical protein
VARTSAVNATAVAPEASSHMVGKKAIVRFLAEVIVEETMTATLANGNH